MSTSERDATMPRKVKSPFKVAALLPVPNGPASRIEAGRLSVQLNLTDRLVDHHVARGDHPEAAAGADSRLCATIRTATNRDP